MKFASRKGNVSKCRSVAWKELERTSECIFTIDVNHTKSSCWCTHNKGTNGRKNIVFVVVHTQSGYCFSFLEKRKWVVVVHFLSLLGTGMVSVCRPKQYRFHRRIDGSTSKCCASFGSLSRQTGRTWLTNTWPSAIAIRRDIEYSNNTETMRLGHLLFFTNLF